MMHDGGADMSVDSVYLTILRFGIGFAGRCPGRDLFLVQLDAVTGRLWMFTEGRYPAISGSWPPEINFCYEPKLLFIDC